MPTAADAFAPLETEAKAPASSHVDREEPARVVPVPQDAPEASFRHPGYGAAAAVWDYRDHADRLLGYAVRFDTPDGKEILPRTWCRVPGGRDGWRWKAFTSPRPLYGLQRLAARPETPVLVVEGEKATAAAQQRFDDHVVLTWPGGSNAVAKADWSPLQGRTVVLWPDADAAGRKAAQAAAKAIQRAGASSVAIVSVPDDVPDGWDLADPVPADVEVDLDNLLAGARPVTARASYRPATP